MNLETFLKRCSSICMEEKHRTIPIAQIIILYELWKSNIPVCLLDIQDKYDLERYIVSRNCMMLSHGRIKDNERIRQGKGWITKNNISDKYDGRMKEAQLTSQGKRIAERLFSS